MAADSGKWFVIVNPVAGSGRGLDHFPQISKHLRDAHILCEPVFTEHKFHATELTVTAVREGYRRIIVVGGDGTLLRGAQYALSWDAALLGVNLGRVGFLAEGEADALPKLLDKVIRGDYETERRAVLSVQMNGQSWYAINDVVMSRGGYARLITVTALVDGELAGHYIADGLVVATPTGSTGYSLSAGGPIISPKVDCMVLTPICAHSLQHRPTVVQGSAQIRLLLGSDAPQSACLQVDGQTYAQLDDGAVVEISRADRTLQLIRTSDQPFFNLVREKLTEWTR